MGLLAGSHLTPAVVASIVRLGVLVPFAQVPPLIAHFTGVRVSAETVRRLTEAAGAAHVALETAAVDWIERTLPEPPAGPAVQLLSVDGAMVPLVGGDWAEVKTLAIGTVEPAPAAGAHAHTRDLSYFSRLSDAASFTRLATVETQRRGTETAQTVVAVVDGAAWCQGFIDHHRHDAVRILDFAHALAHLGQVAQVAFGPGTAAASAWLGTQAQALRHGNDHLVRNTLAALGADAAQPVAIREIASATCAYLAARRAQVRYAAFANAGYPLGSGCVESANKLVVEARLKGSGMHWARRNVNPLVALRTLLVNGRWEASWPALWAQLRQQRHRAPRQRRLSPPAPTTVTVPPPQPPLATSPCPKLVVNGKPTADHPWRRASPYRAKP